MSKKKGFDLTVHHLAMDRNTRNMIVTRVTPYISLMDGQFGQVFLREGVCFSPDGTVVDPIPEWVKKQMVNIKAKALADIGFKPTSEPDPTPQPDQNLATISGRKGK